MREHRHYSIYRPGVALAAAAVLALTVAACGDDDTDEPAAGDTTEATSAAPAARRARTDATVAGGDTGGEGLQVLFGSSGDAETNAIIASAERFTEATGTPVEVIPAQDLRAAAHPGVRRRRTTRRLLPQP